MRSWAREDDRAQRREVSSPERPRERRFREIPSTIASTTSSNSHRDHHKEKEPQSERSGESRTRERFSRDNFRFPDKYSLDDKDFDQYLKERDMIRGNGVNASIHNNNGPMDYQKSDIQFRGMNADREKTMRIQLRNHRSGPDRRQRADQERRLRPYPLRDADRIRRPGVAPRENQTEDPLSVPRQGRYFEHDDRDGARPDVRRVPRNSSRRWSTWHPQERRQRFDHYSPRGSNSGKQKEEDRWVHDRFEEVVKTQNNRKTVSDLSNYEYSYDKLKSDKILGKGLGDKPEGDNINNDEGGR